MVTVIWHGHACFELMGKDITIICDPFTGLGIPEPIASADIVLCSHSHGDHNNAGPMLKEKGTVLEEFVGSCVISDVSVTGIATFHDAVSGRQRGANSVYVVRLDDLRFCHLGDLGHDLTLDQIKAIGTIDVLFPPVGGGPTIALDIVSLIVERLNPRIVVPMHYNAEIPGQIEFMSTRLHKIDDFLSRSNDNVERLAGRSFRITKNTLPQERTIMIPTFSS